jgi:hypothetical protein
VGSYHLKCRSRGPYRIGSHASRPKLTIRCFHRYFYRLSRLTKKGPLRVDLGDEDEEDITWGEHRTVAAAHGPAPLIHLAAWRV